MNFHNPDTLSTTNAQNILYFWVGGGLKFRQIAFVMILKAYFEGHMTTTKTRGGKTIRRNQKRIISFDFKRYE